MNGVHFILIIYVFGCRRIIDRFIHKDSKLMSKHLDIKQVDLERFTLNLCVQCMAGGRWILSLRHALNEIVWVCAYLSYGCRFFSLHRKMCARFHRIVTKIYRRKTHDRKMSYVFLMWHDHCLWIQFTLKLIRMRMPLQPSSFICSSFFFVYKHIQWVKLFLII